MVLVKAKKPGRTIVLILVLAVLCISGTELVVCRMVDPALFDRITAPVRSAAHSLQEAVSTAHSDVFGPNAPGEEQEGQLADEPAVQEALLFSDPAITELTVRRGREVLTGGTVEIIYYNQSESPWAEHYFGKDLIKQYGCGPTAMAMAVSSLSGQTVDPAEMAEWAYGQGYWASNSGSYLSIVEGTARAYGLSVSSQPDMDADGLRQALASGSVAVALMTEGHFTKHGHFILLRGTTLDGGILVADPNSTERSLVTWDAQLILDELSKSRDHGAPLWLLSAMGPDIP